VITGIHAVVFSPDADKVRAFFADELSLPSVDAGGGWRIFALPPAELAIHPADGDGRHESQGNNRSQGRLRRALGAPGGDPPARRL